MLNLVHCICQLWANRPRHRTGPTLLQDQAFTSPPGLLREPRVRMAVAAPPPLHHRRVPELPALGPQWPGQCQGLSPETRKAQKEASKAGGGRTKVSTQRGQHRLRPSVRECGVFAELLVVELAGAWVGRGRPPGVEGGGLMPLLSGTLLGTLSPHPHGGRLLLTSGQVCGGLHCVCTSSQGLQDNERSSQLRQILSHCAAWCPHTPVSSAPCSVCCPHLPCPPGTPVLPCSGVVPF